MIDDMARGRNSSRSAGARVRAPRTMPAQTPGAHKELLNYEVITTDAAVRSAARRLRRASRVALDIETAANRGSGAWNGAPRLIQIGVDDASLGREQIVVDCFAADPSPLFGMLEDPEVEKVIHWARFEQEWFAFHYGVWLPNLYDTCLAWQAIERKRVKDDPDYRKQSSKLTRVADEVLDQPMDKSNQASFWGRGMLSVAQLEYAALDVAILHPIVDRTKEIAAEMGLEKKIRTSCDGVAKTITSQLERARKRGNRDESIRIHGAIARATSLTQLERVWASSRQVAVHYAERRVLTELYERRRAELDADADRAAA